MSKPRSGSRTGAGPTPPRRPYRGGGSAAARHVHRVAAKGFVPRGETPADRRELSDRRGLGGGIGRWVLRDRARPVTVAVLVVAVLLVGGGVGYLGYQLRHARAVEAAYTDARAAAGRHAPAILSYDYRHLDRDFAAAKRHLTGGFAEEYATTTEDVVREQAAEHKAVVKAEPAAVSVVSAEADTVRTLLFVNQVTTSARLDGPKTDFNRVLMTLQRVDGRWLVSDLDAL